MTIGAKIATIHNIERLSAARGGALLGSAAYEGCGGPIGAID